MKNIKYWAVIPAAGLGLRMNSHLPKQYLPLNGTPILEHTIKKFLENHYIEKIVVVLNRDDTYWQSLKLDHKPQILTTWGGKNRAESVLNGLELLKEAADEKDWILVHDAVRPYLRQQDIDRLIEQVNEHPIGGILGIPVRDTLKLIDELGNIRSTLSREKTWHAQTPQMFRYQILLDAIKYALNHQKDITDEASAIELMNHPHKIIHGDPRNIKITFPEDLTLTENFFDKE